MEVRLLGPVDAIDAEGRPIALGGGKERLVLAVLAAYAPETVSHARLADALWGDSPPRTAHRTVQSYVARLRRALGGGIDAYPGGYRLAVQRDVDLVESLLVVARDRVSAGQTDAAARILAKAEGIWRGPSLGEFAGETFALAIAARLDELRVVCVEESIAVELACGRHRKVVGRLDELCAEHPFRERLWGERMVALYRCGRQADALKTYDTLRRILADELGVDPSPEIRRLHEAILRQDEHLRATADPSPVVAPVTLGGDNLPLAPAGAAHAASYRLAAGREALARDAYDEAEASFTNGLTIAEESPGEVADDVRLDLWIGRARAFRAAGDYPRTRTATLHAATLANAIDKTDHAAAAALILQRLSAHGEPDPELKALLTSLAERVVEPGLRARVIAALAGYTGWCEGDFAAAERLQAEAIRLAERAGDALALADALTMRTTGEPVDDRTYQADAAVAAAQRSGDTFALHVAYRRRYTWALRRGDRDQAESDIAAIRALESSNAINDRMLTLADVTFAALDGRFDEAESLAFGLVATGTAPGAQSPGIVALTAIAVERGRVEPGLTMAEAVVAEFPAVEGVRSVLASMLAETGRNDEACEHLGVLIADGFATIKRDASWPGTLAYSANAAAVVGDREAASAILAELRELPHTVLTLPAAICCLGATKYYIGICETAIGALDDAVKSLEEALVVSERLRSLPLRVRTTLWLVDALLRRDGPGDAERAHEELEWVAATARDLGMAWVERRAGELAAVR